MKQTGTRVPGQGRGRYRRGQRIGYAVASRAAAEGMTVVLA